MTEFKLKAIPKEDTTKKLRRDGKIPAVVYGKKFESMAIALDKLEFDRVFRHAGTSNLIDMTAGDKKFKTLVHDFQINPMTGNVIHVDFMKINMKEKIHAEIPLKYVGESSAVSQLEGSLITPIDTIEIECMPADLPAEIEVDLSVLDDFEKNIKVSDLIIPAGVEVLSELEEVLAFVQEPRSEEEMADLDTEVVEDISTIEVENKGEDAPAAEGEAEKQEEKE
jgi:large subunit ribosomal protein L25